MDSQAGPRQIYRAGAMRRYLPTATASVLPSLARTRALTALWTLVGLLLVGGLGLWLVELPLSVSGVSVIVDPVTAGPATPERVVVAFLPAEHRSRVRPGQAMFVAIDGGKHTIAGTVTAVRSSAGGDMSEGGLTLPAPLADALAQLSLVVVGSLQALPPDVAASGSVRGVHPVRILLGTRPVIALLPGVGDALGVIP